MMALLQESAPTSDAVLGLLSDAHLSLVRCTACIGSHARRLRDHAGRQLSRQHRRSGVRAGRGLQLACDELRARAAGLWDEVRREALQHAKAAAAAGAAASGWPGSGIRTVVSERIEQSRRRHRICTDALLVVNVLLFAASRLSQGRLLLLGAKINHRIVAGEVWRLVTPMLLHANLLHLATNCFSLNAIGPKAELIVGPRAFLSVYAAAGVCGTLASFAFSRAPSLGASGAIFGLVGALAVVHHQQRKVNPRAAELQLANIASNLLLNVLATWGVAQVDHWAHVGGFVGGALACWAINPLVPAGMSGAPWRADEVAAMLSGARIGRRRLR